MTLTLRPFERADRDAMLEFARALPTHDLLFLRRDITEPKVLSAWVRQLETGAITSLLARSAAGEAGRKASLRYGWDAVNHEMAESYVRIIRQHQGGRQPRLTMP